MAENKSKSILKPVYFNPKNPKELELLAYYQDKFTSFGGIVKDLLHKQMMLEKGGVNITYNKNEITLNEIIENDNEDLVNKDDVSDYPC